MKKQEGQVASLVVWATLLLAFSFWMASAAFELLWFNENNKSFLSSIFALDEPRELMMRLLFTCIILAGGFTISRVLYRLQLSEYLARKQEEHIRITMNSIGDGVIATDTLGHITDMNPIAERLTGWSYKDAKKQYLSKIYHKMDIETGKPLESPVKQLLKNEKMVNFDKQALLVTKQGVKHRISDSAAPIKNLEGKTIGVVLVFRDITKEYSLQQKVTASEEKFRIIFESSRDAIFLLDPEKGFLDCNPAALEIFSFATKEKFCDYDPLDLSPFKQPDGTISRALAQKQFDNTLDQGMIFFEWWFKGYDQRVFPATVLLVKTEIAGKKLIQGTIRDITQRKKAEKELIQAHEFTNALLEAIPTPVFYKDKNGIYLGCNQAFTDMIGISHEDIKGKSVMDLWPSEHAQVYHQKDMELIRSPTHQFYEFVVQDKNSKNRSVIFAKDVFRDEKGNVNGMVGAFLDITERKKVERELKRLQNYLTNIIDSMPSVLIGVDAYGKVTLWNSEAKRLTGIKAHDAVDLPLSQVLPSLAEEMDKVEQAIAMKQVRSHTRKPIKRKGYVSYQDVTIYPLLAEGMDSAVIRVDDVTERVRLEEMMVQSEKMLSVGGLAAGMAHEINNPLAGMMQTASVMTDRLTDLKMPANRKAAEKLDVSMAQIESYMRLRGIIEMLDRIRLSGKRASDIVQNMLSFARKREYAFSENNITALLDQTVDLASSDYDLKKKYDFKQIKIIREYEEKLPLVKCEPGEIQQVLLNILRNGAEAMRDRARKVVDYKPQFILRLAYEKRNKIIRIEIQDNGPGMDQVEAKRVFEPFFTTKSPDKGTGLGLSVSYFIITENHGGTMNIDSEVDVGSKFTIKLPLES